MVRAPQLAMAQQPPKARSKKQEPEEQQQKQTQGVRHRQKISPIEGRAVMFDVLKGGYGKSALSVNVADRLAARGHDVLYLDLDPNGHITSLLGYESVYNHEPHDYGYVVSDEKVYGKVNAHPHDMIYETDWGWDFVPSYDDMELFSNTLREMENSSTALADGFLSPLFEAGEYDYFVMDGGGESSKISDNGFYAGQQAIIPLVPGEESISAWTRTWNRVVEPMKKKNPDFKVLAAVPNMLTERIDYQTKDRRLLEHLNQSAMFDGKVPSFAQITEQEWEDIDNGDYNRLPGIRRDSKIRDALGEGMPVAHYDEECRQIEYLDELATIVENGGINHV